MIKRLLLFLLLYISILAQTGTKKYIFEKINIQDGLSQSTIHDIVQDRTGFLWFCTDNGLNRYDGIQFKNYFAYDDSLNNLTSNRIYCGAQDSRGYLWFGTEVGLNKIDPRSTIIKKYYSDENNRSLSNNTIWFIYEDKDSILWIGTDNGLNRYNRKSDDFTRIMLEENHNRINTIIGDKNDSTLWIGSSLYGLYKFNKHSFSYDLFKPSVKLNEVDAENNINSIQWIDGHYLYLATDAGLGVFDSKKNEFISFKSVLTNRHSFSNDRITGIQQMPDSTIWVSTWQDGIIILDENKKPVITLKQDSRKSGTISNNRVLKIFLDKQNIVWVGTYSGGINKFDNSTQKFKVYNTENSGELNLISNEVWQLFEDSKNNIWVCSDEGVTAYNKNKKLVKTITKRNSKLSDNNSLTITEDKNGNIWIGTLNGLNKYLPGENKIINYFASEGSNGLLNNTISFLYADDNYNLWIGTASGLNKLDIRTDNITRFDDSKVSDGLKSEFITSIIEDHTGEYLWIGTLTGLNKFNKKTLETVTFNNDPLNNKTISSDRIYGLLQDSKNTLWVCTFGGGINRYVEERNYFVRYRESDGLSNDLVYGVIEDEEHTLWMSTNYGITRFDPVKNEFTNFDVTNGLQSNEFNYNSYMKTSEGEIFFGGVNGINSFFPDKIFKNTIMPNTKITSFKIYNNEVTPVNDNRLKTDITFADEIELDYNENIFTIGFSSLNFSSPEKNQYQYKIEGLYDDWILNENRNFASFSNIPPGSYLFRVKGSNNDNVWDDQGASLNIIIKTPLWKSWWAYLIYASILGSVILLFIYIKFTSQKREIEALQKADKLKSEFLAQMSHEIRTPINVILSFAGLLKEEVDGKVSDDLKMGFRSISNAGKRITRTIDLILNMSEIQSGTYDYKPEKINIFEDVLLKLSIEFKDLAEKKKIKLELNSECKNPVIFADEYTVEQIFANLIDNAIKFTEKGGVSINVKCSDRFVFVEVADTGKGINKEFFSEIFSPFSQEEQGYTRRFEGNGLGLSLVKNYCEINNAVIDLESEYGKGTKFKVVFEIFPK